MDFHFHFFSYFSIITIFFIHHPVELSLSLHTHYFHIFHPTSRFSISRDQGFRSGGTPIKGHPLGGTPFFRGYPVKENINKRKFQKNGQSQKLVILHPLFFLKTTQGVNRPLILVKTIENRKIMIIYENKRFDSLRE